MRKLKIRLDSMSRSRKRWLFEVLFLATTLAVTAFCLSILLRAGGWPDNQDYMNAKFRTEVYAAHFKDGDFFPVWSSSDGFGMGTPMPLYYQKVFYYIAGLFYIITGSAIKVSLALSLVVIFLVGAYGMRRIVSKLTQEKLVLLLVPQALLLANYTFTDWLIRGDLAELTAMMLIPWLIYWCLTLIQDKWFSLSIILLVVLLVFAHNAIAMIMMLTVAIACTVFVLTAGKEAIVRAVPRAILSLVFVVIVLAPMLLTQLAFNKDFDPAAKITQGGLSPASSFPPAIGYILPDHYGWFLPQKGVLTQVDYGIWVPIALACSFGIYLVITHRGKSLVKYLHHPTVAFLAVSFVINGILLFHFTLPVYNAIRPLQLLQFPWRFLAILTPVGIILVAYLFADLYKHFGRNKILVSITCLWLLSFILLSPIVRGEGYPFISGSTFDPPTPATVYGVGTMIGGGEYLPKTYTSSGQEISSPAMQAMYQNFYTTGTQASGGPYCSILRQPISSFEVMHESFVITCSKASSVFLPITYSRYMRVDIDHKSVKFRRVLRDPRLIVDTRAGSSHVTVTFPTLGYMIGRAL